MKNMNFDFLLAKEESEILLNITNELNKQLEAQKAIESQIDALQKEDGDVLIWAATSRGVNGQIGGDFLEGAIAAAMVHLFNDYAFKVDPNAAGGNGHTTLYFQDKNGQWYAYNQGANGETSSGGNYGFLFGIDAKAGVSIEKIDEPSDYNVRFDTSSEQDYKIYRSAISSQTAYNRGKIEYNIYSDSCTDAAVDVINNSNIGVTVQNPIFTIRPNAWIKGF